MMIDGACTWTNDDVRCQPITRCLAYYRYFEANTDPSFQECLDFFRFFNVWWPEHKAAQVRQHLKGGPWTKWD